MLHTHTPGPPGASRRSPAGSGGWQRPGLQAGGRVAGRTPSRPSPAEPPMPRPRPSTHSEPSKCLPRPPSRRNAKQGRPPLPAGPPRLTRGPGAQHQHADLQPGASSATERSFTPETPPLLPGRQLAGSPAHAPPPQAGGGPDAGGAGQPRDPLGRPLPRPRCSAGRPPIERAAPGRGRWEQGGMGLPNGRSGPCPLLTARPARQFASARPASPSQRRWPPCCSTPATNYQGAREQRPAEPSRKPPIH